VIVAVAGCGPSVPFESDDDSTTTPADDDGSPTNPTTLAPTSADDGTSATTMSSTSTSTGTETTSTETVDDSSEDAAFIEPTGNCFTHCSVGIECDIWAQDCPEGEKCMPWANDGSSQWNTPRCAPIAEAPGAPGDPCAVEGSSWSGVDDCDIATICWNADPDTLAGSCVAFCGGSEANPTCAGQATCFTAYDDVINLCLPSCNPLAPACEPGLACVESYSEALPDTFACVPASLVADRSTYAAACDDVIGCGTGLLCTVPEDVPTCGSECCTMLCDPLAANVCPDAASGQVCIAHAETPTLGHCGFR